MNIKTCDLKCVVDNHNSEEWDEVVRCFNDCNLYQTYAYGSSCYGKSNISTVVIKKGSENIGAALVRIRKIPGLPVGVAYIRWGPMFRRQGKNNSEYFAEILKLLTDEYVFRRGLVLRIRPFLYEGEASAHYTQLFRSNGFEALTYWPVEKTLLMSLTPPPDYIRKNLNSKWRGHLNRAEKSKVTIVEGTDDELFDLFKPIHEELLERKALYGIKRITLLKKIQEQIPNDLKMRVILCKYQEQVCAGIIVSQIGKVGITLSRATSHLGRQIGAAYLIQWRALNLLRDEGCHYYDLSGINKIKNPGTYSYKTGLCGKNGEELQMMHQFQACRTSFIRALMNLIDHVLLSTRRT